MPGSLLLLLLLVAGVAADATGDAEALLKLKSSLDVLDRLPWRAETAAGMCSSWPGVRQCAGQGRVTKLVLEGLNLTGSLSAALLAPLGELRVLSLRSNALTGPIPGAFPPNLKLLYLADNRLDGRIPASLALLHRATVVVLSGNRLSGQIPASLAAVPRLTSLLLDRNLLTGPIPELGQRTLRRLNVSSNRLEGRIPGSLATRFHKSSFLPGNAGLCGPPLPTACPPVVAASAPSPPPNAAAAATAAAFAPLPAPGSRSSAARRRRIAVGATVAGVVVLAILLAAALLISRRGRNSNKTRDVDVGGVLEDNLNPAAANNNKDLDPEQQPTEGGGGGGARGADFSWEREGIGKLVFCGGSDAYSLEELLRASAETLGRGEVGSTYKAVMETGFIVTVKRMRDPSSSPGDFGRRAEELGRLRHPNVVPLRAYFQAKEERLLVYDYYPNGSLFALVHGSRPSSKGKPLHWTSCMKIAEDVAAGLVHLHQSPPGGIVHGNLKPSNVLLGPDFESCLTDYGLVPTMLPGQRQGQGQGVVVVDASSISLLYRAPEVRAAGAFTPASDVYSFGVLLLELLTGRTPFQDLLVDDDIPGWVRAVRDEERETDSAGDSSGGGTDEKLTALIGIAAACVAADPGRRPSTPEVLRMVREARAEAMSSSNSSDRSPARWSDAILGHHQPQAD